MITVAIAVHPNSVGAAVGGTPPTTESHYPSREATTWVRSPMPSMRVNSVDTLGVKRSETEARSNASSVINVPRHSRHLDDRVSLKRQWPWVKTLYLQSTSAKTMVRTTLKRLVSAKSAKEIESTNVRLWVTLVLTVIPNFNGFRRQQQVSVCTSTDQNTRSLDAIVRDLSSYT